MNAESQHRGLPMPHRPPSRYDLIFFDCDSTLSHIEGIDELARLKGKAARVGLLTNKAMDGELDLAEVYGKRLKAIRPTRAQLKAIEERYWETAVEDAAALIAALQFLGRQVFIISGGLIDAVRGFGRRLGIPAEHIRAVELEYNQLSGEWWRYHEPQAQQSQTYLDYSHSPLTISSGKSKIIQELSADAPGRRLMIGDGSSDLAAKDSVDLFVGYGGVITRPKVQAEADIFIRTASLAAILPLAAGRGAWRTLQDSPHAALYRKGIRHLSQTQHSLFRPAQQRHQLVDEFKDIPTL